MKKQRTPAKEKAKEIAKLLREEHPDYNYLKSIFRHLRTELEIEVTHQEKKLPKVPTEEELQPYSGHSSRQSLEIYSRLSLSEAQSEYDSVMPKFPL